MIFISKYGDGGQDRKVGMGSLPPLVPLSSLVPTCTASNHVLTSIKSCLDLRAQERDLWT